MTVNAAGTRVVVIGSGFGGAVAALRLAEKGYRVTVLEAGRRFADDDLPRTSWNLRDYLWAPALGCYGIQRIHRLRHVVLLAGAGVGGGSLNYANTLYVPPPPFFADRQWGQITDWAGELAPHYDQASRMLGVTVNPCDGPVEQIMKQAAEELGVGDTFAHTPVGVLFTDRAGEPVPDPYFGGVGPERTSCNECGACMTGCRVGAKNTLTKNYLALAERAGARIVAMRTVVDLRPDGDGFVVAHRATDRRSGALAPRAGEGLRARAGRRATHRHRGGVELLGADRVVVAAGTWGTQELLHGARLRGSLPLISARLGELTRTNSEALLGSSLVSASDLVDGSRGVAITTSFHPDSDTHIENVRYGRGSNAMGLLATVLVDGGGSRPRQFLRQARSAPSALCASLNKRRWSERSIIGLVMQSLDNSLTLTARLRRDGGVRLISHQGHGLPNPSWIPAGHRAIRVITRLLAERAQAPAFDSGSIGDVLDIPMTAHFLGGCPIGESPSTGVVDPYHRLYGYPGISVVDGSAVSANLGVNPALTITAQAERACSLWPNAGEPDQRPDQGAEYRRLAPIAPHSPVVPPGSDGELRWNSADRGD